MAKKRPEYLPILLIDNDEFFKTSFGNDVLGFV